MSVTRHVLRYSPGLTEPDTWRLLDSGRGIVVRMRVGTVECSSDLDVRWKSRLAAAWPSAVYACPADSEGSLWLTASADIGGGLLRRELQLERAPQHVADVMRQW